MITTKRNTKNASVDERALRRQRRNEVRSAAIQALSSPTVTDSKDRQRDTVVVVDNAEVNEHRASSNKTHPAGSQQDSHHSVSSPRQEQSPTLDGDLTSGPLHHPTRTTNATTFSREQNEKINFPPVNDPTWKDVNPFEVGARGFVAKSTFRCLSVLGLSPTAKKKLVKSMSYIAARCSYTIYLARSNIVWDRNMPLLRAKEDMPVSTAC